MPFLIPALMAAVGFGGGGTLGFNAGESEADTFWRETLAMLNTELDEEQAKRDACWAQLIEVMMDKP